MPPEVIGAVESGAADGVVEGDGGGGVEVEGGGFGFNDGELVATEDVGVDDARQGPRSDVETGVVAEQCGGKPVVSEGGLPLPPNRLLCFAGFAT